MPSAGWGSGAGWLFVTTLPSTDRCPKRLRPWFSTRGEAVLPVVVRQKQKGGVMAQPGRRYQHASPLVETPFILVPKMGTWLGSDVLCWESLFLFLFWKQINNCLSCFLCILQPFVDTGSNHSHNPAAGKQPLWVGVPPALLQHPAAVWSLSTNTSSGNCSCCLRNRNLHRDKPVGLSLNVPVRNNKAVGDFSSANSSKSMAVTLLWPVGVAKADRALR